MSTKYDELKAFEEEAYEKRGAYEAECVNRARDLVTKVRVALGWPSNGVIPRPVERLPEGAYQAAGGFMDKIGRYTFGLKFATNRLESVFTWRIFRQRGEWFFLGDDEKMLVPLNDEAPKTIAEYVAAEMKALARHSFFEERWT